MRRAPLILIMPSSDRKGVEFEDASLSLSAAYPRAVELAGGIPWIMPVESSRGLIAECVRRCDGVMLTGGDDVQTSLYAGKLPAKLKKTVFAPDPARDHAEMLLIAEVFRQGKPLLAICRGLQILNVAFGGDLIVDIPSQVPGALRHKRFDLKNRPVHDIEVASGSLLEKVTGQRRLRVNSTHHQAAGKVAGALRVTARSPDGVVEALELNLAEGARLPYLLAVQFHPERLLERQPEFRLLFRSFVAASASSSEKTV